MKSIITLLILFAIFPFVRIVYAVDNNPSVMPTVIESSLKQDVNRVTKLEAQLELIRNENYLKAIQSAQDTSNHADRLLSGFTNLMSIIGVVIAIIAFLVGKDIRSKLSELGKHAEFARKNAEMVSSFVQEAEVKVKQLTDTIKDYDDTLRRYKSQISTTARASEANIAELEGRIDALRTAAIGTVSQLEALKTSADFVSNATYGLPITCLLYTSRCV